MLWRHPDVLKLWALYILFVTRDLGLAPATIGAVFSVANVAGLAGAIVAGGLGLIPAVLATRATAVPLLVLSGLLGSFSGPVYNINQVSLRQAITPDRLQGRMNATMRFLVWGTMPDSGRPSPSARPAPPSRFSGSWPPRCGRCVPSRR